MDNARVYEGEVVRGFCLLFIGGRGLSLEDSLRYSESNKKHVVCILVLLVAGKCSALIPLVPRVMVLQYSLRAPVAFGSCVACSLNVVWAEGGGRVCLPLVMDCPCSGWIVMRVCLCAY